MPKFEIDGETVEAEAGTMIIEVADRIGVAIPRFCYHRKLSIAANCRMCLVHVDKAPKPLPACATPIAEGMKVWTNSKEAVAAQRSVMEFLLINHPLDCPVCDQGGECELQDVSLMYGRDDSRYTEPKRAVLDHNLGPLIATEMTRCIHCTRCVRFGEEISGQRELGATGRGEFMEIGTFIEQNVNSEVSGNVIDLCPVGALTSKPFRFKARAWELTETPSISPHDCIGSNLYVHTLNQKVMRVVPQDNENLNEVWLSDRDRFSYEALSHEDRLRKPLMRKQEKWSSVPWVEALKYAIAGLRLSVENYGADKLGALVSPSVSNEEYYLLQKLIRSFGCNNIDHRLRQLDFSDQELAPLYPNLGIEFRDLQQQDTVLLIGSNIAKEQPLASMKLRKMVKNGGKIAVINPVDYKLNFAVTAQAITPAAKLLQTVAGVARALLNLSGYKVVPEIDAALTNVKPSDAEKIIAAVLLNGTKKQIILGQLVMQHPQASAFFALGNLIAKIINGHCGQFSDGANAAGAWLTGCVPHRIIGGTKLETPGLNALQMLQAPLKCYILYNIEPEYDSILGMQAAETLKQADFVIAFSAFQNDMLLEVADVILPLAQFSEFAGSMLNIDGVLQQFAAIVPPYGDSKPGWKILRVLGNLSGCSDFEYTSVTDVTAELQPRLGLTNILPQWQTQPMHAMTSNASNELLRIAPIALYAIDPMVRRATSLQATQDAHAEPVIEINAAMAQHLNVAHDELVKVNSQNNSVILKLCINDRLADHTAVVYQANPNTLMLGTPYTKLEITKC